MSQITPESLKETDSEVITNQADNSVTKKK